MDDPMRRNVPAMLRGIHRDAMQKPVIIPAQSEEDILCFFNPEKSGEMQMFQGDGDPFATLASSTVVLLLCLDHAHPAETPASQPRRRRSRAKQRSPCQR